MRIKIRSLIILPLLTAVVYMLARAWCADHFGMASYLIFIGIVCAFIGCYFLTYKNECVKIRADVFNALFFLFIFYVILNLLVTENGSSYALFEYVFYMMYFFASCFVLNYVPISKVINIYEIVGMVIAIEAIWEFVTGIIPYRITDEIQIIRRAYGLIGSPLTLGMILAAITLMCIYEGIRGKKAHYVFAGITFLGLIVTQSRGPLVGFIIGVMIMLLCQGVIDYNIKWKAIIRIILKIIFILMVGYFLLKIMSRYSLIAENLYKRVQTIWVWSSDESSNYLRANRWSMALELVKEKPFLGIGVSSTGSRATTGINVESGVLKKLVETGIIGFTIYYAMMIWAIVKNGAMALKHKKDYTPLALGIISAIFIENIVMQIIESAGVFFIFMLFLCYLIVVNRGGANELVHKFLIQLMEHFSRDFFVPLTYAEEILYVWNKGGIEKCC